MLTLPSGGRSQRKLPPVGKVLISKSEIRLTYFCCIITFSMEESGLAVGSSLHDFYDFRHIGEGAFAIVYRARCRKIDKEVAIKVIDKKQMKAAKMLSRVSNEIMIHSRLDHPSILKLYNYFEDEKYVYLVLQLCENGELQSYMKNKRKGKAFSEPEARDILQQVVDGLIYLQSQNVIHRDLKLSNILLTKDMKIKIADFGLSALSDVNHKTMCGTPNFIAPEVATRSGHGQEADVFSLGCLLYTMLAGKPPFDSTMARKTLTRAVLSDPEIPRTLSHEAQDLIRLMLKKSPRERITLQEVDRHAFLRQTSSPPETKPAHHHHHHHQSVDSGVGSSPSSWTGSSLSSKSSTRHGRQSPGSRFDSRVPHSGYSQGISQPFDSDSNVLPSQAMNSACPRFGRSPPVRLTSSDRVHKSSSMGNLRARLPALPPAPTARSADFYTNLDAEEFHESPVNRGHDVDRDVLEDRVCPPKPGNMGYDCGADTNSECNNCVQRGGCNNNCGHSDQGKCHHCPNTSQGSCHGSGTERGSSCSQCTETYDCGREHCRQQQQHHHLHQQNASPCCSRKTERRFPSPSACCRHNVRNEDTCDQCAKTASCSHYGHCDIAHCKHTEKCCCRTSPPSAPNFKYDEVRQRPATHPVRPVVKDTGQRIQSAGPVRAVPDHQDISGLPPCLNSQRLNPLRCMFSNYVVTILANGEVCLERLQKHHDKLKVVRVYRISQDGLRIVVYKPGHRSVTVGDEPVPVPEKGADEIFGYENMPLHHRKVYEYASRFVSLAQAKTAKITFFTHLGKCVLMENGDFEVIFDEGGKISRQAKNPSVLTIVCHNGKKIEFTDKDDVSKLETDCKLMLDHFRKEEVVCRDMEKKLEALVPGRDVFPITSGRPAKPPTKITKKHESKQTPAAASTISSPTFSNMASCLSTVSKTSPNNAQQQAVAKSEPLKRQQQKNVPKTSSKQLTTKPAVQHSNASQENRPVHDPVSKPSKDAVVSSKFIPEIGWASVLSPGGVRIQYNDGTQLKIIQGDTNVHFTDSQGVQKTYDSDILFPDFLREKVSQLPYVMKVLSKVESRPNALRELPVT